MLEVPYPIVILEWLILFVLMLLIVIVYRQLAYLLHLGAGSHGIEVGSRAPRFTYRDAGGSHARFPVDGLLSLLLFTDPRCVACDAALRGLEQQKQRIVRSGVQVLVATDVPPEVAQAVGAFDETSYPVGFVEGPVPGSLYKTTSVPFLFGIDRAGRVVCKGSVADTRSLKNLIARLLTQDGEGRATQYAKGGGSHAQPEGNRSPHQ